MIESQPITGTLDKMDEILEEEKKKNESVVMVVDEAARPETVKS